jgi:hypothetical protein
MSDELGRILKDTVVASSKDTHQSICQKELSKTIKYLRQNVQPPDREMKAGIPENKQEMSKKKF